MENNKGGEDGTPWLDAWVALAFSVLVFAPIVAPLTAAMVPVLNTNTVLAVVGSCMMVAAGFLVWRLAATPKAPAFEHSRGNAR